MSNSSKFRILFLLSCKIFFARKYFFSMTCFAQIKRLRLVKKVFCNFFVKRRSGMVEIFWVKSCSKLKRASRTFLGAWGFENACCGVSEAMGLVGVASVRAFVCCAGVCLGVLGICALDSVLDSRALSLCTTRIVCTAL